MNYPTLLPARFGSSLKQAQQPTQGCRKNLSCLYGIVAPVRGTGVSRNSTDLSLDPTVVTFEEFYAVEFDGQARRAVLLLGDSEAAFDVVQTAFVAVLQRYDQVSEPGRYLNTAVLNGCRDHARRTRVRQIHTSTGDEPATITDTEVLSDVLMQLPFNQRAAVVLKFYGGLNENEIAERLECPPGSIGPWIHRALNTLGRKLT